jgi:S-adenosylmethionine:tRNA ribosyltransferase-isomerase
VTAAPIVDLTVPEGRTALTPPERRGVPRDGVRMMVVDPPGGTIEHARFAALADHLRPGDAVVVNRSRTIAAAVRSRLPGNRPIVIHFVAPSSDGLWTVELRTPRGTGTLPGPVTPPLQLPLPGGGTVRLLARSGSSPRLWVAAVDGVDDVMLHLAEHGAPIRYADGQSGEPADYQTVFAAEPGSAEMPSAGRPFTDRLVTKLVTRGVVVLPILLHTGVSSYEEGETPGPERFEVPETTARVVNSLRRAGGRVVAVGTTVVRALETAADGGGAVHPAHGVTDLVVTPERGVRAVDGLVSGWHEPRSSHLRLLEAVAGQAPLRRAYDEALAAGYHWHQFGDVLLVLPSL